MPPEEPIVPVNPNNPVNPVAPNPNSPIVPANPAPANAIVNAASPPGSDKVGVFVAPQTLVTFPVASAAVTTVWQVLGRLTSWGKPEYVLLIIALVVGLLIYLATVSKGTDLKQKIIEIGVAIINSFTIAAAALGIGEITK